MSPTTASAFVRRTRERREAAEQADGDFPAVVMARSGRPRRAWIGTMIEAVIKESLRGDRVRMVAGTLAVLDELRDFRFARADRLAGMADRLALRTHERLFGTPGITGEGAW